MEVRILYRKIISLIIKLIQKKRNLFFYLKVKTLGLNINFGKNISVGDNVKIYTGDGGKITLGDEVFLDDYVCLQAKGGNLNIGNHTYIGAGCQIVSIEMIDIGENCLVAAYSIIRDADHGMISGALISKQKHKSSPIVISEDVWIGSHVVITAGTKIGASSIIGANSVVTKDIGNNVIAVGVPSKKIRDR